MILRFVGPKVGHLCLVVIGLLLGGITPDAVVPVQAQGPTSEPRIFDLAEQLAPPGVAIGSGDEVITTLDAIAMRQELRNLLGRFESAWIAAQAQQFPTTIQKGRQTRPGLYGNQTFPLIAGLLPTQLLSQASLAFSQPLKAIMASRSALGAFSDLVAQGNYRAARRQWLAARQTLWQHYPLDQRRSPAEIRAVWLDRGTIVAARNPKNLAKIFDRLAGAGINTVFFETVNAGYPIYPSKIAPARNPLIHHWDPLEVATRLAHERRMELHTWIWTFAVGNRGHNRLVNLPDSYLGPVLSTYPEWASLDNRGQVIHPNSGKVFVDPANPQARQYLLNLVDEIVTRYPVDGVQLDYIRYPFQDPGARRTYGYGKAARQQFQQLTGVDPVNLSPRSISQRQRDLWQQWTQFRVDQVSDFVAEVSRQLRRRRPELTLSAAVFPFTEHDRIHKLQQHWEDWAQKGVVDLVVPMTYAMETNRFERLARPWVTTANLGATLVSPGIRLLDQPPVATMDQIQVVRDLPASGYALFAAAGMNRDLERVFEDTQGQETLSQGQEPIPYRQPFATAAARYQTLHREWEFLGTHNKLWLSEPTGWAGQNQQLDQALTQLSGQPNPGSLEEAQAQLSTFKAEFDGWMTWYNIKNPYQVRAWQHRLDNLEQLLAYGDRRFIRR